MEVNLINIELPEVSRVLLKTEEDYDSFYIGFYGKNRYVIDDLFDYREEKLLNSKITLDSFIELCYTKGKQQAFEETFLQVVDAESVAHIEKAIIESRITLEDIYNQFQEDTDENILKYVL